MNTALATSAVTVVPVPDRAAAGEETPAAFKSSVEPSKASPGWGLMLLDAAPPGVGETGSTEVGDIDGDGKPEIVIGGVGAMLWYRPATFEKGLVARGHFHCGVALVDIDGDGIPEIVAGWRTPVTRDIEVSFPMWLTASFVPTHFRSRIWMAMANRRSSQPSTIPSSRTTLGAGSLSTNWQTLKARLGSATCSTTNSSNTSVRRWSNWPLESSESWATAGWRADTFISGGPIDRECVFRRSGSKNSSLGKTCGGESLL
jgi:FG-GAP-like repeat